jgi:hypothetical protein
MSLLHRLPLLLSEDHNPEVIMLTKCGGRLVGWLWILIVPGLVLAQDQHRRKPEVRVTPPPQDVIQIAPETDNVRLEYNPQAEGTLGPWPSIGTVKVKVRSVMPTWGTAVEAVRVRGPQGELPPERIWVRTEETARSFVPLTDPVPVVVGDHRTPERETELEVEVRPEWDDPPGEYDGELLLRPFSPPEGEEGITRSPRMGISPGPGLAPGGPYSGRIAFSLSIPEMIDLGTSGGGLEFLGVSGPGTYYAKPDLRVRICTNAAHWQVVCSATNLEGESGEIPAERIIWELIDSNEMVGATGNLGLNVVILEGYGTLPPTEVTLRFSLEITIADVAGDYRGTLSVNGMTNL